MQKRFSAVLALGLIALAAPAMAQAPAPHVRGTITKVDGDKIEVKTRSGDVVPVTLDSNVSVAGVFKSNLADIKPGSFIGTAAAPQPDGSLKALEVTVFPPGVTGGDGHYAWDLEPNSTMTNGTVGELSTSKGRVMTVKYPNGEKQITVPDDVPVVSFHPSSRAALVVGARITLNPVKAADGSTHTARVQVGEGGTIPPA
jgi:hypothetical protein